MDHDYLVPTRSVLQAEWDALSPDEQMAIHESFAHLCDQGIADTLRFYPLLMPKALVGYVGD